MGRELIGYLGELDSGFNVPFVVISAGNLVGWLEYKLKQWVYGFTGLDVCVYLDLVLVWII